jgi:two-component system response regulator VanR
MTKNVLIVDDDPEIREVIHIYLRNEGFRVLEAEEGGHAIALLRGEPVDLIILDVMMPGMDGIRACLKIREESKIPIIMLSAKGEEIDKIAGLTTGADDYVTKPFHPLELIARVKAQFRRQMYDGTSQSSKDAVIRIHDLTINKVRHMVTVRGEEIALTPIEFSILELLASHSGHVFSVDKIYQNVWNEEKFLSDNTIMVHIRNIREKIEENSQKPQYIKTVRGIGYKMD